MRFGLFLVQHGRVTADDVLQALDHQRQCEVPIGKIALRERMLSVRQVFDVLNHQVESRTRFGEAARHLGYLTTEQVDHLLETQRRARPPIGQILLEMRAIDPPTLAGELDRFQRRVRDWEGDEPGTHPDARAVVH